MQAGDKSEQIKGLYLTQISEDGDLAVLSGSNQFSVTQSDSRGLLHVIDELRREDTPISRNIADHIDSFTDYDFAHLLFSDGTVENAISLDNQLNIIQVADLVLPDKDTTFEEYTTIELLSVSMLIVISTFALDFIHSDRSIFKIVDLDEAWAFLNVAQGETLSNKLHFHRIMFTNSSEYAKIVIHAKTAIYIKT